MINLNRLEYKYLQYCAVHKSVDGVSLCYAQKPDYWVFCLACYAFCNIYFYTT